MASIRIHQDQENRIPELRQKQTNNAMAAQQNRPVLGTIDHNKVNKALPKGKQPLKPTNTCDENSRRNKNLVAPVVPVAQFEAFKVYEDDEYLIDQKLKVLSKSNVYVGTAEDRFITKTELAEIQKRKLMKDSEIPRALSLDEEATPMSVEKLFNNENDAGIAEKLIKKASQSKGRDSFYEIDEYREDIYGYLRQHELRHRAKPGYIVKQPDVTENMRTILVDWLVEVTEEYKMHTETLYLAVNFIDRFLSYMSVVRAKLQLVGTAAMFIASKYEEIFPPHVSEFVYITDDTYDKHQVIRMEHLILKVLGFDLSIPTPLAFINIIRTTAKLSEETIYLAMYVSELALLEVEPYLRFLPSALAASAIALARHTLGVPAWNQTLHQSTGYSLTDLKQTIMFLNDMFVKAPTHPQHAIQDKYKSTRYFKVSTLTPSNESIKFDD